MQNNQLQHHQVNFKTTFTKNVDILLDQIDSPANLGSVFRNAEAFNVGTIWIKDTNKNLLDSNRFKRTARSTEKYLNISFYEDFNSVLETYKGSKIGVEITESSKPMKELNQLEEENILLVLGNEKLGIDDDILKTLDAVFHIEMSGQNSSLNVAQTLGIALYEIRR